MKGLMIALQYYHRAAETRFGQEHDQEHDPDRDREHDQERQRR